MYLSMFLKWFLSSTVRRAGALRKHVLKLLHHQSDILKPEAVAGVQGAICDLDRGLKEGVDKPAVEKLMSQLELAANKWLKPYPNAALRENIEVLLVAMVVALGIRTFILQPFKIPTGSMQPTLFGATSSPDFSREFMQRSLPPVSAVKAAMDEVRISTGVQRIREWFAGVSYVRLTAKADGELEQVNKPFTIAIFSIYQTVVIGGVTHWIWFPPDYGGSSLEARAGLRVRGISPNGLALPGTVYKKGDEVVRMKIVAGDHLFVDRVSFNFRQPQRGEIIVFQTKGIPEDNRHGENWDIPDDQFYIKRLVGLGGERVQIGSDRHLIIDGKELDAATPHFENVYSFDPKQPARESKYSGHVDGNTPYFRGKPDGVAVPEGWLMVMGDNTLNSLDSRFWGPFRASAVIGKSFFVYWPITERFGWGVR